MKNAYNLSDSFLNKSEFFLLTDIILMVVNVFNFWLHMIVSVSIENGGEYHGESHYITHMSKP